MPDKRKEVNPLINLIIPLIHIADNEPLGATTAILCAYHLGFIDGRGEKAD